jgi:hypothetical protein
MKKFKESSFGDIGAFVDLSANEYGVKLGGKKATLRSIALMAAI